MNLPLNQYKYEHTWQYCDFILLLPSFGSFGTNLGSVFFDFLHQKAILPRGRFYQNGIFQLFSESFLFHFLGEILEPNGSRLVSKGAWRCFKSFGTDLGSVSFNFPPLKSNSLRKTKGLILSKWRFSVIFRVISFPLFGRNSGTKWIKIGAKRSMEVL